MNNISRIYPYMQKPAEQTHVSEAYVSSPPALVIVDSGGNVFSLGESFSLDSDAPRGEFSFNVLCNAQETGEYASRIERRNGRVRIFTRNGFKTWNGRGFV